MPKTLAQEGSAGCFFIKNTVLLVNRESYSGNFGRSLTASAILTDFFGKVKGKSAFSCTFVEFFGGSFLGFFGFFCGFFLTKFRFRCKMSSNMRSRDEREGEAVKVLRGRESAE